MALGFVGLTMLGLQFALVARFKAVSTPFGIDLVLQYQRQMAYVALLFILAHPLLLFVADPGKYLPLLEPTAAPWRARTAVLSAVALLVLATLSIWRKKLRMSYEFWQLAQVFLVGYYVKEPWEHVLCLLERRAN